MQTHGRRTGGLTLLAVLTLVSFAPLVGLVLSMAVAGAFGCRVDEAAEYPCPVGGADIGGWLNGGFVLGWMTLLTWPGMLLSIVLWSVLLVRRFARKPV